jgi:hypothetical protein
MLWTARPAARECMDMGAVKAPAIQRSFLGRRSRQLVRTSPSRYSRSTELMSLARWSLAAN